MENGVVGIKTALPEHTNRSLNKQVQAMSRLKTTLPEHAL